MSEALHHLKCPRIELKPSGRVGNLFGPPSVGRPQRRLGRFQSVIAAARLPWHVLVHRSVQKFLERTNLFVKCRLLYFLGLPPRFSPGPPFPLGSSCHSSPREAFPPRPRRSRTARPGHSLLRRTKPLLVSAAALLLFGCSSSLRDCTDCPAPHQPSYVTIAAVGDTNGYNIFRIGRPQEDPLQEVGDLLREHDIFILNFEGILLSKQPPPGTCRKWPRQSLFYSSPRIADFLRLTNLTIATLANNHILECGNHGIEETARGLTRRGILTVGAGDNSKQACKPVRLQVNGIGLAVVAYLAMRPDRFSARSDRPGAASWEECEGEKQLAELAAAGDIVVAVLHLHLGPGWTERSRPDHIAFVQRVLDAGADVVIAHGPHVPQGIFQSNGRVALLSLGNFLFRPDYQMPEKAHRSMVAKVTISPDSLTLALLPLRLDEFGRPQIPSSRDASRILREIVALSSSLGTNVEIRGDIGYVKVQRRR